MCGCLTQHFLQNVAYTGICTHVCLTVGIAFRVKTEISTEFCEGFHNKGGKLQCTKTTNGDDLPRGDYTSVCGGCLLDESGLFLMCDQCPNGCGKIDDPLVHGSLITGCAWLTREAFVEVTDDCASIVYRDGDLVCLTEAEEQGHELEKEAKAVAAQKEAERLELLKPCALHTTCDETHD